MRPRAWGRTVSQEMGAMLKLSTLASPIGLVPPWCGSKRCLGNISKRATPSTAGAAVQAKKVPVMYIVLDRTTLTHACSECRVYTIENDGEEDAEGTGKGKEA